MEIKLTKIRNSTVLTVYDSSEHWGRVCGAIFLKATQQWVFPAVPPFLDTVLQDLNCVYPDTTLSTEANDWVIQCSNLRHWRDVAEGLTYVTPPLEYQKDGIAELLCNHRWILNWKMGTGKTKIAIDAMRYLKQKTLILCPLIAVNNWEREIEKHAGEEIKVLALDASSPEGKRKQIRKVVEEDYDALIATYDITRTLGHPHVTEEVRNYCKKFDLTMHDGISKPLASISHANKQLELIKAWHLHNKAPKSIREDVAAIVKDNPYQWMSCFDFTMVIYDESHRIKNYQSKRTKACLELAKQAGRRVLLTGTLSHGEPFDLYPQLKALSPHLMPEDAREFKQKYYRVSPYNDKIIVGYQNLHVLNSRVAGVSSARSLEDCIDLPERRFVVVTYELSAAQQKSYNQLVSFWAVELPSRSALETQSGAVRLMKLLQICSGFVYSPESDEICDTCSNVRHCVSNSIIPGSKSCIQKEAISSTRTAFKYPDNPKLTALKDLLIDITNDGKVIVWAVMTQELDDIEEMLKKAGIGYVRVDGSNTKYIKKWEAMFNTDDSCMVYLAQITTGIAITLNIARYMVYYSRDWSVEHRNQSATRNYRIGQEEKTIVYDLCGAHTVELQQLKALESKDMVASLMTDRIHCAVCNQYQTCVDKFISPWDKGCVLESKADKVTTQAKHIK